MNEWLRRQARQAQKRRYANVSVWTRGDRAVVAYFALCPHTLERAADAREWMPGERNKIPSILLARLALDLSLQGQGLGAQLLVNAVERAAAAATLVAGRYLVVDALDEQAGSFYQRFGFLPLLGTQMRLASPIESVIRALSGV